MIQPHCVILSILCAWTWGIKTSDPVRIAVQHIEPGIDHAQAEACIYGHWTPLTEIWTGDHLEIRIHPRHYPDIEPYRYAGLMEWINENIQYVQEKDVAVL